MLVLVTHQERTCFITLLQRLKNEHPLNILLKKKRSYDSKSFYNLTTELTIKNRCPHVIRVPTSSDFSKRSPILQSVHYRVKPCYQP